VSGGILTAYLAGQNQPTTLTAGEGALVGGSAGIIGAFVWLPVALLLALVLAPVERAFVGAILSNAREMPPEARDALESLGQPSSAMRYVFGFIFQFFAGGIFGAVGGVLGAMFFRKDVPPALGGNYVPPIPVVPSPSPVPAPSGPIPPVPGPPTDDGSGASPVTPDPLPPER
jgi:hypothetical protein